MKDKETMMFTKKGQGMPLSVIITAVIVVVVALVLILVTTDFGKKLTGLGQATPSSLEAATQGCIVDAQNNLITDYCYNYRKVATNGYVNCEDDRIRASLTQQGVPTTIQCTLSLKDNEKKTICAGLTNAQRSSTEFNGGEHCPTA